MHCQCLWPKYQCSFLNQHYFSINHNKTKTCRKLVVAFPYRPITNVVIAKHMLFGLYNCSDDRKYIATKGRFPVMAEITRSDVMVGAKFLLSKLSVSGFSHDIPKIISHFNS